MLACQRTISRLPIAWLGMLMLAAATLAAEPQQPAPSANNPQLVEPITDGQRVFTCGHSFHVWVPGIVTDLCKKAEIPHHVQVGLLPCWSTGFSLLAWACFRQKAG